MHEPIRYRLICAVIALSVSSAVLADEGDGSKTEPDHSSLSMPPSAKSIFGWDAWLSAVEEYRGRFTVAPTSGTGDPTETEESSSYNVVRLFMEGSAHAPDDRFSADLAMGLWWNLVPNESTESAGLESIYSYEQLWANVFTLAADYRSTGLIKQARIGRQTTRYGLLSTFDGVSVLLGGAGPRARFFLFGGRSVHFFETDVGGLEDWMVSVGTVLRPGPSLKLEIDYRYLNEAIVVDDSDEKLGVQDHTYGIALWYRHGDRLRSRAYARGVNADLSNIGAAVNFTAPRKDLDLYLGVDGQPVTLEEINELQDPYFSILGSSLPHVRWQLEAGKSFETGAGLLGCRLGWNGRQLIGEEAEAFNRNTSRLFLQVTANDFVKHGLFARAAIEQYAVLTGGEGSDDGVLTGSGAVGIARRRAKAEIGTYYQMYKYDYYYDVEEIAHVRTVYGTATLKLKPALRLRLGYRFERSYSDIHTVILTLSQIL